MVNFNIRSLLIQALGTNVALRESIDKMYAKRPNEYYKAFRKEDGFYEDAFFRYYDAVSYIYLEKVAGIVEFGYDMGSFLEINQLIKKGYPKVYKVVMTKPKITISDVVDALSGFNKDVESTPETEYYAALSCLVYLINREIQHGGRTIGIQGYDELVLQLQNAEKDKLTSLYRYFAVFNPLTTNDNDLNKRFGVGGHKEFRNTLGIDTSKDVKIGLEIDKIIERETLEKLKVNGIVEGQISPEEYRECRSSVFSDGKESSMVGFFSGLSKGMGFFEPMFEKKLKPSEAKEVISMAESLRKGNKINLTDNEAVIIALGLAAIMKEYREVRPLVRKNSREYIDFENMSELKKANNTIETLEIEVKKSKNELVQKEAELNQKNEALLVELRELRKENEKLNNELSELEKIKQENATLRAYMYERIQSEKEEVASEDKESDVEVLKVLSEMKLIFIGGHEKWINKIKGLFKNAEFYETDEGRARSFKHLKNADLIIFNTSKNSHNVFDRVMNEVDDKKKICFVDGSYNVSRLMELLESRIK